MRQLLTEREAAEFLDLQPATLRHWRVQERGPLYYRIGGAIRYHRTDLEDFLRGRPPRGLYSPRGGEGLGL